ncbi:MAG: ComEA family DNA-binding protein [Acidobacteriota bacterium]
MKIPLLILLIFLLSGTGLPQEDSSQAGYDRFWNNLLEESMSEVNESEISDELENLSLHPVDINSATLEDLLRIPFLNYQEAKAILEHRKTWGRFFSTNELRQVKALSNLLIYNILPYVTAEIYKMIPASANTLRSKPDKSYIPKVDLRLRMLNNSLYNKEVTAGTYSGTPLKLYNRLKVNSKDRYQLGFILEKDAGEASISDFNSFHLLLNSLKPIDALLAGDYTIEFGQGLALWGPYGYLREGDAVSSLHRQEKDIRPYLSTDENSFLRGGALSFSLNGLRLSAFYSNNSRDANLDTASGKVTSFYTSGYHRNVRESMKKDKVKEVLFGAYADYQIKEILKVGILYYRSEFDRSFIKSSPSGISGNRFDLFSLSYKLFLDKVLISGEAANAGRKTAFRSLVELILTKEIDALISFRHYPSGFPSMHSFSSGSSSGGLRQETGIYGGISFKTALGAFDIFYDQFKKEKPGSLLPSNGNKFGMSYSISPAKMLKLNFRYRNGDEEIYDLRDPYSGLQSRQSRTFRGDLRLDFTSSVFIKFHGSLSKYMDTKVDKKESGFMFYEETGVSRRIYSLSARISYFRTDSYYSRIFQVEQETPGSLANSFLYGQGVRWFINMRGSIYRGVSVSLKYSETYRSEGSNMPEEENSSLSLQLDVNL